MQQNYIKKNDSSIAFMGYSGSPIAWAPELIMSSKRGLHFLLFFVRLRASWVATVLAK